jgi:hypothetical protein
MELAYHATISGKDAAAAGAGTGAVAADYIRLSAGYVF